MTPDDLIAIAMLVYLARELAKIAAADRQAARRAKAGKP